MVKNWPLFYLAYRANCQLIIAGRLLLIRLFCTRFNKFAFNYGNFGRYSIAIPNNPTTFNGNQSEINEAIILHAEKNV